MSFKRIDASRASELIERDNAHVIDIRDANSYHLGHIANAEHIDDKNVGEFIQRMDRERPLIVCCYHGNMSQSAAEYFNSIGFADTYSLDGGYVGWQSAD